MSLHLLLLSFLFFLNIYATTIYDLSLEQRVGQLLVVHFNGKEANDNAKQLIQQAHVGGFIYYSWANGLENPEQVRRLSQDLQELNLKTEPLPLFIMIDQEGGILNRLKNGFTLFPSAYTQGSTESTVLAYEIAYAIGQELSSVGINVNLAPVIDVNNNPKNPIIGTRSFGSNPESVMRFGEKALQGYQKAQIIAAIKHFPGHGDTQVDSHEKLPTIPHSKEHLNQIELFPFKTLSPQAELILTAHLLVPALDQEQPVTFSKKIISDLLRNEWKYKGLIITDSLVMKGIMDLSPSIEEAAIRSFEVGHDLILLGGKQFLDHSDFELDVPQVLSIHKALVAAVKTGRISEKQIDESVQRIINIKEKYKLEKKAKSLHQEPSFNLKEHELLAQNVADKAYEKSKNRSIIISLTNDEARKMGNRIWKNESGGKIEGLTAWNTNENFASMGIGHFIWYPKGVEVRFHQTFPELLLYFKANHVQLPVWLNNAKGCPWKSRSEFLASFHSTEMIELRQLLQKQFDLQVNFMIDRLQNSLSNMLEGLPENKAELVKKNFQQLAKTRQGVFVLLDYLNFKGEGTSERERYKGEGWGLLQVLGAMEPSANELKAIDNFVGAAKMTLEQRVKNAPAGRNEQQWLKGWYNRLDSYL